MNKHESDRCRDIAWNNTILTCEVGSTLHGCNVDDQDDLDLMSLCVEPPECVIGLDPFEQYQWRSQPEGHRSGPGDVDFVSYSLRKWLKLAAAGNPTVLLLLFIGDDKTFYRHPDMGERISSLPELLTTRECGRRFLGYLNAQKESMLGLRSKHTNRPELIEKYMIDTKFAYHALRLGMQGVELLETGRITLPMSNYNRTYLKQVRTGGWSKEDILEHIDHLADRLAILKDTVDLPDKPDYGKLNAFLIDAYQSWWSRGHSLTTVPECLF